MKERAVLVKTEKEMLALGRSVASHTTRGAFFALYGELGSGKSVFARGFASYLDISSLVSPTFTIVSEYPTEPKLFHFDAYRLSDEEELYAIGYSDYRNANGIILMEWANLVTGCLPERRMDVYLHGSGTMPRTVAFVAHGEEYESILEQL